MLGNVMWGALNLNKGGTQLMMIGFLTDLMVVVLELQNALPIV